jgi:hypothetical protein
VVSYREALLARVMTVVIACAAMWCAWCATGSAQPAKPPADGVDEIMPHLLVLTVVDKETRKPLDGVKVRYLGDENTGRVGGRGATDAAGQYSFDLPTNKLKYLGAAIRMPGYIPMALRFRDVVPGTFTLEMERGQVVGGTVLDEDGRPVVGAKVTLHVGRDTRQPNAIFDTEGDWVFTAEGGAWNYDRAPAGFQSVRASAADPRYVSGPAAAIEQATPEDALARRLELRLARGKTVRGTAVDEDGRPLENVVVRVASADQPDLAGSSSKSARDGAFRATVAADAGQRLVLTLAEHAPELIDPATAGDEPVRVTLRQAQPLRLRFADLAGRPVPGAWLTVKSWRGVAFHESIRADAAGRVVWPAAPADEVQADVYCPGFQPRSNLSLKASGEFQTITLTPTGP